MIFSLQIKVIGKVQGVWFRKGTQIKANSLGLKGNVQNLKDGSVFIEVHGNESKVMELVEWCKVGTTHANVDSISYEEIDSTNTLNSFEIIR